MNLFGYITEEQIVEGVLGASAFVIFFIYLREYVQWSVALESFVAWTLFWWMRKVGVTLYRKYKAKE
uniref:Uncharacterized protein n=1 Tax=viral metagenome TaxID=1070528 RepID=A0A6C0JBN3_9ZZZZ